MPPRVPVVSFLLKIKRKERRTLIYNLAQADWNTPDCEHFQAVEIKNDEHTSHSDSRPHITLRMRTAQQIAQGSGQTIHVYYDPNTKNFEAFKLFSERKDKQKDRPE